MDTIQEVCQGRLSIKHLFMPSKKMEVKELEHV